MALRGKKNIPCTVNPFPIFGNLTDLCMFCEVLYTTGKLLKSQLKHWLLRFVTFFISPSFYMITQYFQIMYDCLLPNSYYFQLSPLHLTIVCNYYHWNNVWIAHESVGVHWKNYVWIFHFTSRTSVVYEYTKSKHITCYPFCVHLIKQHTTTNDVSMEACFCAFFNLDTRWRWVFSFMPWPLDLASRMRHSTY